MKTEIRPGVTITTPGRDPDRKRWYENNKLGWILWGFLALVAASLFGYDHIHNHNTKSHALATQSKCDPNYTGYCVPNVTYDLDCSDIRHRVTVVGSDDDNFDADHDGVGCESY